VKITAISAQVKNQNRVNISVDGSYRFSLDVFQVSELGIKIGNEYSESELQELEDESVFGKLYARTVDYCLLRPHSAKEIRDYLYKKTFSKKYKSKTGELKDRDGVSKVITDRVFVRLQDKGYIDDEIFARWWVENRHLRRGSSMRKLYNELRTKGIDVTIIENVMRTSQRNDNDELQKVIMKKQNKYEDEQKLVQYLMRQGFRYDDIRDATQSTSD
jgi:regulatory protein